MNRTIVYLDETQARALSDAARAQGVSRAALIRRMIDRGLAQAEESLDADLAAIEATFNVGIDDDTLERGTGERARHVEHLRSGR